MKKYLFLSLLLSLLFFACKNKSTEMSAKNYNHKIENLRLKLYKANDSLESKLNADNINLDAINSAFSNAKSVSQSVLEQINNMTPFDDQNDYLNSAKDLFSTIDGLFINKYPILIKYLNIPLEQWTDSDFKHYYDTWDELENKIIKKENVFFKEQDKFIHTNNLEPQKQ